MAVRNLLEYIELDGAWVEADLEDIKIAFIAAIKLDSEAAEEIELDGEDEFNIDVDKITKVGLELGIDVGFGVEGEDSESQVAPVTTQILILDFKETTSRDEETNKATAFTKLIGMPSTLYIKPLFVDVDEKRIYEGIAPIEINLSN